MEIKDMTRSELLHEKKIAEKSKLRAHQKQEYFGMLVCQKRIDKIDECLMFKEPND